MFVKRDGQGKIVGVYATQQFPDQETVDPEALEVVQFINPDATGDDLQDSKKAKLLQVKTQFTGYISAFTQGYTLEEMLTWTKQEEEAIDYTADNQAPAKLIRKLSQSRNVAMNELSVRIRKKSASYKYGSGVLIGERQRCEDIIDAAVSVEDLDAVVFAVPADFWADVQAEADAVS